MATDTEVRALLERASEGFEREFYSASEDFSRSISHSIRFGIELLGYKLCLMHFFETKKIFWLYFSNLEVLTGR